MDYLFVIDRVSDYPTWRKVFDADGDEHQKFASSLVAGPNGDGGSDGAPRITKPLAGGIT